MNLCSNKHQEICFNGYMCPLCDILNGLDNIGRDYRIEDVKAEQEMDREMILEKENNFERIVK